MIRACCSAATDSFRNGTLLLLLAATDSSRSDTCFFLSAATSSIENWAWLVVLFRDYLYAQTLYCSEIWTLVASGNFNIPTRVRPCCYWCCCVLLPSLLKWSHRALEKADSLIEFIQNSFTFLLLCSGRCVIYKSSTAKTLEWNSKIFVYSLRKESVAAWQKGNVSSVPSYNLSWYGVSVAWWPQRTLARGNGRTCSMSCDTDLSICMVGNQHMDAT